MKKLRFVVLTALATLLLAGCAAMFDFNLYKGMDKPKAPTAADYNTADPSWLDKLSQDLSSPAVMDALSADPAAVAGIEAMLWDNFLAGGVSDATDQEAAILYAELNLASTGGDELVNNIVNTAMNGVAADANLESVFSAIIPQGVAGNQAAFEAMISALLDANDAYTLLGNSITDVNVSGALDAGDLPAGTNLGDVAQKAAISYLVSTIATTLSPSDPAAAGTQLYYLIYDPTNPALTIGNDPVADPFTAPPQGLLNIFTAVGLPLPA